MKGTAFTIIGVTPPKFFGESVGEAPDVWIPLTMRPRAPEWLWKAGIGLYGLMSYTVVKRTSEIGIRMALGAQRGNIVRLVMHETLVLVLAGLAVGLPVAFAATRLISSLLFGLKPTDPMTISAASLLLIGVAAVAGYLPARRATRVDPMVALRCE